MERLEEGDSEEQGIEGKRKSGTKRGDSAAYRTYGICDGERGTEDRISGVLVMLGWMSGYIKLKCQINYWGGVGAHSSSFPFLILCIELLNLYVCLSPLTVILVIYLSLIHI